MAESSQQHESKRIPNALRPITPFENVVLPPFPVHVFNMDVVTLAENMSRYFQVSTDHVAVHILGSVSAALTGKIAVQAHVDKPDWLEPVNLYIVCVLPSGSVKSPVHTFIWQPLEEFESKSIREVLLRQGTLKVLLASTESELESLHAIPEGERTDENVANLVALNDKQIALSKELARTGRRQVHDYTQEALARHLWAEGIAVANPDEVHLPTFFGTRWGGKSNITIYLIAHSGKSMVIQRATTGVAELDMPLISILLSTQSDPLRAIVEDEESRHRGLFARFLICEAPDTRAAREWDGEPIPEEFVGYYRDLIGYFLSLPEDRKNPKKLVVSKEASNLLGEHVVRAARMSAREEYAAVADWLGKYAAHCSRIAGILHMLASLESDDDAWDHEISAETVAGAVEITDFFLAHTLGALRAASVDPVVRLQKIVLRKMLDLKEEGERLTFNNVWQRVKGRSADFKSRQVLHDALDGLVLRNYVIEIEQESGKPGRPGRLFRLHPAAATAFTARSANEALRSAVENAVPSEHSEA